MRKGPPTTQPPNKRNLGHLPHSFYMWVTEKFSRSLERDLVAIENLISEAPGTAGSRIILTMTFPYYRLFRHADPYMELAG
jgi:hypothetical protein